MQRTTLLAILCTAAMAGCGGGGGGGTTPAAATTAAALATTSATGSTTASGSTPAAVAAVLNLDLGALSSYAPQLPAHYDAVGTAGDNTPATNRPADAVATLGRVLFYDRKLSANDTVSCASCHQQAFGFSDPARFSRGFEGGFTTAHAMRLGNVRYYAPGQMFWDRRAATLEAQATQPVQNGTEMGFDAAHGGIAAAVAKLQATSYYPDLFTLAFGDSQVTEDRIQRALAQFQRAMVSGSSRWDTAYAQVFDPTLGDRGVNIPLPGFTASENRGRQLFMAPGNQGGAGCAACHTPPTFALAANSRSNGLDAGETTIFKSPSLKSVARAGAFMHDGRFATLEEVVEFYDSGVQNGPALDNRLRAPGGQPRRLNLSAADKAALVDFLRTLNDDALASDARFADPFR